MNEFVVILKLIYFKIGNWKMEILKIFKFNGYKKFLTLIIIFSNASMKQSKRIIEAEPTKWLQSKIFENQSEFDILTKDSVWSIEKWALKKRKK